MFSRNNLKVTKAPELKPLDWESDPKLSYATSIAMRAGLCLLVALILVLCGCSKATVITPMPPPPENLAANCAELEGIPDPLIDPARVIWESSLLLAYADCATKHRLTVEAWREVVKK